MTGRPGLYIRSSLANNDYCASSPISSTFGERANLGETRRRVPRRQVPSRRADDKPTWPGDGPCGFDDELRMHLTALRLGGDEPGYSPASFSFHIKNSSHLK